MGPHRPDGYEYTSANGYRYRKVDGEFVLVHHIIAEQRLGRPLDKATERVVFVDNDRSNLNPDNIEVRTKVNGKQQRIEAIKAKIASLQEELASLTS